MKTIKELMGLEEADKMKGEDPCWDTHQMVGMKMKNGKKVPNCVPKAKAKNEEVEIAEAKVGDTVSFHHELKSAPGSKVKKSGTVEKVDSDVVHVKVKDKYGVKRHQIKMGDLVKEDTELEEASDTKRPPNFTMHPIDRQDYKILRPPKKTPPKDSKEWGRDGGEKKIKEETESVAEGYNLDSHIKQTRDRISKYKDWNTTGSHDKKIKELQYKLKELLAQKKQGVAEETEQIDELNKDTVYSYNRKADADIEKKHKSLGQLMRKGDAAGANKAAHQINRRLAGMERAEKRLNTEEVEQIDEISAEVKQKYLAAATKKHLQQFLGRAPVRGKQELDKRRAAIQKTSKELTGKTHYQEEIERVVEGYKEPTDAAGHAKMASKIKKMLDDTLADRGDRHGNPDPQQLTRAYEYHMQKAKVDPKDLVVSLKDVPVKNPRGSGKYKPEQDFPGVKALKREETELELDELRNVTQDHLGSRMGSSGPGFNKTPDGKAREVKRKQDHLKSQMQFTKSQGGIAGPKGKLPEEVELEEAEAKKVRMTPGERAYKRKIGKKAVAEPVSEASKVETAAQVTKHFEKGQSTPSGVPKWVAEPVDNPKLADKFMKAFRKMKTAANVSCKTYGTVSTCEETELDEAAKAKMKGDPSQSKNVKRGEPLSGKQEPVKLNPELQEK